MVYSTLTHASYDLCVLYPVVLITSRAHLLSESAKTSPSLRPRLHLVLVHLSSLLHPCIRGSMAVSDQLPPHSQPGLAFLLALCVSFVACHPLVGLSRPSSPVDLRADPTLDWSSPFLSDAAALNDFHPRKIALYSREEALTFYSWHIHVYFFANNNASTTAATALRDAFIERFKPTTCNGSCDLSCPTVCVWGVNMGPIGPHPIGSFGAYLPTAVLSSVVEWASERHGSLSVLFHPNTGYAVDDHAIRGLWLRQMIPLNLGNL